MNQGHSFIIYLIYLSYRWMYNAFMIRKKTLQENEIIKHSHKNHKYIQRYLLKTRPSLIDSHNKRINSFIRRMEEEPIRINLDPSIKTPKNHQDPDMHFEKPESKRMAHSTNINKGGEQIRKRAASNISWDKATSMTPDQVEILGSHYFQFKFKDNEDFKSLFTHWERLEREKNFELFKQKYGDPTIAFRSIASQSQYKSGHNYRDRNKEQQIHPPMKYTNKPTKQVLANIKNKKKLFEREKSKKNDNQKHHNIRKSTDLNLSSLQEEDIGIRKNTGSSSGFNDNVLDDNNSVGNFSSDGDNIQEQQARPKTRNKEKEKKPVKLHFKEIMDLEQNITDPKTKKALRDILFKCGVYRRKNRRAVTDSEVDQFSEFEAMAPK